VAGLPSWFLQRYEKIALFPGNPAISRLTTCKSGAAAISPDTVETPFFS